MEELFTIKPDEQSEIDPSYKLSLLEVFNWGPFAGKQKVAEIHPGGTAIIGSTGSGKTTLIDALMTLLVPFPKYNLASTGGHESDRDMVSYVRGVAGTEKASGENDHLMRPGRTVTGLSADYSDAEGRIVLRIGGLLWFEGNSNSASDLKKLWFVLGNDDDDLSSLLRIWDAGGKRELKKYAKSQPYLDLYDSKKNYLAKLRRFFEVGENAFQLLNRAAGLKQLNSINNIFRELVLDNKPAFDTALKVAKDFDTLADIREELEVARRQLDSLMPIEKEHQVLRKKLETSVELKRLKGIIPIWFAEQGLRLWLTEVERLSSDCQALEERRKSHRHEEQQLVDVSKALQSRYMELGGDNIDANKKLLEVYQKQLTDTQADATQYDRLAQGLGLKSAVGQEQFLENQKSAQAMLSEVEKQQEKIEEEKMSVAIRCRDIEEKAKRFKDELAAVERSTDSNVPAKFQAFRQLLAQQLGIHGDDLPFLAELVEVKPEEVAWRGAIERALGAERLYLLVPEVHLQAALDWVRQRDNQVHVRLQKVASHYPQAEFFTDGFIPKLNRKNHPYHGALEAMLSRRDRHCVSGVEQLRHTSHAMTIEGLMSNQQGRFEKQDQRPLHHGWMTGFDNQHQVTELRKAITTAEQNLVEPKQMQAKLRQSQQQLGGKIQHLQILLQVGYERIDLSSAEQQVNEILEILKKLESPDSDLARAREDFEKVEGDLKEIRSQIDAMGKQLGGLETKLSQAEQQHDEAAAMMGDGLDGESRELVEKRMRLTPLETTQGIVNGQRKATDTLDAKREKLNTAISSIREKLVRLMESAKEKDTGALLEIGSELSDIPDYLDRLQVLLTEDLPARKRRFIDYLNVSSGQGVTQLLTKIEDEVSQIVERIDQLNATLGKVEYKTGKYLLIEAAQVRHEARKRLDHARQELNHAMMKDDEGESHYKALKHVVGIVRDAANTRHTLGSQALLDPRHRLQFFVREVDRATGEKSGQIAGSQTGSGGEKEMMASYILTASLSYALCPKGATRPRYATIVLDEAFSKSSQSAATRIIKALREFGLHPLFVTPNKEMSLLRSHTRSAILVHKATLTSVTWRELDEMQVSQRKN